MNLVDVSFSVYDCAWLTSPIAAELSCEQGGHARR